MRVYVCSVCNTTARRSQTRLNDDDDSRRGGGDVRVVILTRLTNAVEAKEVGGDAKG